MEKNLITVTGVNHRYGTSFIERGDRVILVKEPDNEHDKEAIAVEMEGLGKIGYVANSVYTVLGDCMSAGRIYDRIGDRVTGTVKYVLDNAVICEIG